MKRQKRSAVRRCVACFMPRTSLEAEIEEGVVAGVHQGGGAQHQGGQHQNRRQHILDLLGQAEEELAGIDVDGYIRQDDALRAYYYFQGYLDQLIHPVPSWDAGKEPDYSIETVMNTYLSMQVPAGAKRSHYSLIQKLIRQNWPNTTALNNIRNHKVDVPRKLLLLLYVVTENTGDTGDPYRELDESYITLEERLEDHWWTLNAMLSDCGMAPLDLRNPFDWLILYAICADESEYMSDRMEQVLAHLFPENKAL